MHNFVISNLLDVMENPEITFEDLNVSYILTLGAELIEITGKLIPFNSGRCTDYEFEPDQFLDDISEKYYDENWSEIQEKILEKFWSIK